MKKLIASMLMVTMLVSLSLPAFAAEGSEMPVVGHVLTQEETELFWAEHQKKVDMNVLLSLPMMATVKLNRNVDGFQGVGCGYFVAEDSNVSFVISNAPGASTYNVGMLDSHGNPVSDWYPNVPVNNPVNFRYLIHGEEYHFVVSSSDVPEKGCTAVYEVY